MTEGIGIVAAVSAGLGTFLLFTALAYRWTGLGVGPSTTASARRGLLARGVAAVGADHERPGELATVVAVLTGVGAAVGFAVFGGVVATLAGALSVASIPVAAARARRRRRLEHARDAWPRLIEEIRLAATSLGRSIPQALLDVGGRGPEELRGAFAEAEREWLLSTDFERTLRVLKRRCADATVDKICETLLVAHEIGGADVDRRLAALAEDRMSDLHGRKDALSKQAGARFARRFVLVVPLGMALVGLSIGDGRSAYATPAGQASLAIGVATIALCWWWAGRLMRLPDEQRVFAGPALTEQNS